MKKVRVGSMVKLASYDNEVFGSCRSLADRDGVDLTTHLEVTKVVIEDEFTFVYFLNDAPNLSGSSLDRFEVVTY